MFFFFFSLGIFFKKKIMNDVRSIPIRSCIVHRVTLHDTLYCYRCGIDHVCQHAMLGSVFFCNYNQCILSDGLLCMDCFWCHSCRRVTRIPGLCTYCVSRPWKPLNVRNVAILLFASCVFHDAYPSTALVTHRSEYEQKTGTVAYDVLMIICSYL